MTLVLDGVMLIGCTGTVVTTSLPLGSRAAVWGWSDGDAVELKLDGARIAACDVERPDVPPPGRGFVSLLPELTAGAHRVEATSGGMSAAAEFVVAPLAPAGPYLGRIDDVWIGGSTFLRAGDTRFELPLGGSLLVEGWTLPAASAEPPWFLLRIGELDIVGEATIDRPDVASVHAAIPVRCGFATTVPADVLQLGYQNVTVAVPSAAHARPGAADAWAITDATVFRGVAYGSLPVFVRMNPSHRPPAEHTVHEPGARVLFTAGGIPIGGYRSTVEPQVFRVEPRYAEHDGLVALEFGAASEPHQLTASGRNDDIG